MRIHLAMLLAAAAITINFTGCRQTTPATVNGTLTPLSATNPAAAPTLNPFGGGPTRVSPPPTGSYSLPNSYMGGAPAAASPAPSGFAPSGVAPPLSAAPLGGAPGFQRVGSGVVATGWTDASAGSPPVSNGFGNVSPGSPSQASFPQPGYPSGPVPTSSRGTGGMQAIDLTGAPAPPGYHPQQAPSVGYGGQAVPGGAIPRTPVLTPIQPANVPQLHDLTGATQPAPQMAQTYTAPPLQPGPAAYQPAPTSFQTAPTSMNMQPSDQMQPREANGSAPVSPPATGDASLSWRRPGATF